MVVDSPVPFGPRKPKVSPVATSKSMPRTASISPYLLVSALTGIPKSPLRVLLRVLAVCREDGAGHLGTFWRVALPLAAPAVAATGLIVFAGAWNDFLFALTLYSQHALTMPIRVAELVDTRGVLFWVLGTRA